MPGRAGGDDADQRRPVAPQLSECGLVGSRVSNRAGHYWICQPRVAEIWRPSGSSPVLRGGADPDPRAARCRCLRPTSSSVPLTEINDSGCCSFRRTSQINVPARLHPARIVRTYPPATSRRWALRCVQGRTFDSRDRAEALPVAVVSDLAAARFWPNQSAIGKRLSIETVRGPVALA